jgi:hypothetical protein
MRHQHRFAMTRHSSAAGTAPPPPPAGAPGTSRSRRRARGPDSAAARRGRVQALNPRHSSQAPETRSARCRSASASPEAPARRRPARLRRPASRSRREAARPFCWGGQRYEPCCRAGAHARERQQQSAHEAQPARRRARHGRGREARDWRRPPTRPHEATRVRALELVRAGHGHVSASSEASRRRLPRTPTRAPRAHGSPPRAPAGALRRGASVSAHGGARPKRVETRDPQPGGRAASAYPRRAHEASRRLPRAGARRT